MEELDNLTQDDVLELITDFPVQPRHRRSIVTLNTRQNESGLDLQGQSGLDDTQYVVATSEPSLKPGQRVLLDLTKLMVIDESRSNVEETVGQIQINPILVNGRVYSMVNDNVIIAADNR